MTYNNNNITSFVVFKYDFCKTRNLSKVEGTLPLGSFPVYHLLNIIWNVRMVLRE